jgi:hypothetical protein
MIHNSEVRRHDEMAGNTYMVLRRFDWLVMCD